MEKLKSDMGEGESVQMNSLIHSMPKETDSQIYLKHSCDVEDDDDVRPKQFLKLNSTQVDFKIT